MDSHLPAGPNNENFELIANSAPALIWASGPDKLCCFFNSAWLNFTGRTFEQEYGNGWAEGVHHEDLARCLEIYTTAFDKREKFTMEYRLRRYDGAFRWITDSGVPRYHTDGSFAGYVGSCMDIESLFESERVRTKGLSDAIAAMGARDHHIRQIVANAPFPIGIYVGREMRIEFANQSIIDVWGKGNDVVGKLYSEVLPELAEQNIYQQLDDVFTTGVPFHARNQRVDLQVNHKIRPYYFNYSFTALRDEHGEIYGVMNTAAEVTDIVLAKQEAEHRRKQLFNMILQAPVAMCIMMGDNLVVEVANQLMIDLWGKPKEDVLKKPIFEGLPEVKGQGLEETLANVYQTGKRFKAIEQPVQLLRNGRVETVFQNFIYEAYRDTDNTILGVIATTTDVTEQVKARQLLQRSIENERDINEELAASNEELAAVNEELIATNEELSLTQENLQKSEKLFRSIAVNIPKSIIIVIDKEHRFIAVEGELMTQMGFNGKDYEGKHPLEVGSPERYESSKHLYERVLKGEQFSEERVSATGEIFMVHMIPLVNESNEVYAGLIIALDITEMKEAERRSGKLAAIIHSSEDAIISKTLEGIITSWNQSAERIFGYTEAEMIGASILTLIPEDRRNEEVLIVSRIKNKERVEHFETKRVTKDGKLIDISLTISPVFDSRGDIIGISKIARDISEKKQEETRKSDFIGMVSHELKTPLTSLTAIIQVLNAKLKTSGDAFIAGGLEKANTQVKRMSSMINGFLNVSRLESGKILIEKHDFDLTELIREAISETELTVSSHQIQFDYSRPLMVHADHDKIGSVVSNLLSNAVKYSPNGSSIGVYAEEADGMVHVSVKDDGMGIKPHDMKRLFDRYYRVQSTHTKHISGFGIGLYLSAEIINRHNGKIWVESESGVGSTFHFTIPAGM